MPERFKTAGARFDPTGEDVEKDVAANEVRLALSEDRDIALVRKDDMVPLMAKFVGKMPKDEAGAKSAAFAQQLALSVALELEKVQGMLLNAKPDMIAKLATNLQATVEDHDGDTTIALKALSATLEMIASMARRIEEQAVGGGDAKKEQPSGSGPSSWATPTSRKAH